MAYRRDVFCEIAFLEKHRDATPARYSDAENIHRNVYHFLAQNANLKLDVANKAELSKHCKKMEGAEQNMHTSDLIFRLAKQHTQGEEESIFSDKHQMRSVEDLVDNVAERVKYTYLLNNEKTDYESYRQNYGVVVLSPDCWKDDAQAQKHQYLFEDSGKHKSQGEPVRWVDIFHKKLKLSDSNAMVIIDNYICSKGFFNIRGILNALLPGTRKECLLKDIFHLTIITSSVVNNSIEYTYNGILEIIKDIRPKLKIKFDIFINKTSTYQAKENHDRYILTNNVIITSGYGFGLLYKDKKDEKIKTSGELNIMIAHPGIQNFSNRTDEAYVVKLSEVHQQIFNEDSNLTHYPTGEPCTNRLILSMAELVAKANDTKKL